MVARPSLSRTRATFRQAAAWRPQQTSIVKTPLLSGETPVKDGGANLQRGVETVGGWLYLTNQRVVFESHAFNVQTGVTEIPLASISGIRKCWTKFLNLIPLFPNSFGIT